MQGISGLSECLVGQDLVKQHFDVEVDNRRYPIDRQLLAQVDEPRGRFLPAVLEDFLNAAVADAEDEIGAFGTRSQSTGVMSIEVPFEPIPRMARDLNFRELHVLIFSAFAALRTSSNAAKFVGVRTGCHQSAAADMVSARLRFLIGLEFRDKDRPGVHGDDLGEIRRGVPERGMFLIVLAVRQVRQHRFGRDGGQRGKACWTSGSARSCSVWFLQLASAVAVPAQLT